MKRIVTTALLALSCSALQAYGWGNGFSVDVEGLYWSMSDNFPLGVDAPSTTVTVDGTPNVVTVTGASSLKKVPDTWQPGVRVWLGWNGFDCWDVKGLYTYYYNNKKLHLNGEFDDFWPLADLQRTFNYNVADLELGKSFKLCSVVLRPFIGVRGAWLNPKHRATFLAE